MKIHLFVLLAVTVAGCSFVSKKWNSDRRPTGNYGGEITATIDPNQKLSFEKLQNIIEGSSIDSMESLLAHLGQHYPEYLNFHTLMYNSLSLHESSFEEPRAIVFGPDAKFVITFNGNNKQSGGHALEVMEFSEKTKSFEFREIVFLADQTQEPKDLGFLDSEIESGNDRYVISKPNPGKCLQCHGETASPIWATYFVWPGAFGSNDDHVTFSFHRDLWNPNNRAFFEKSHRPQSQGRMMILNTGFNDAEYEGLSRYVKNKSLHPRFKWLPTQYYEASVLSFSSGKSFFQVDASQLAAVESEKFKISSFWPSRPNLAFQRMLMNLNQERIIHLLKSKNLKNAFQSEVWEGLLNREYDSGVVRKDYIEEMSSAIYRALQKFQTRKGWPSRKKIKERLISNLKGEIMMQIEKVTLHQSSLGLGENSLKYYSEESNSKYRNGMEGIGDPEKFYSRLLGKKHLNEIEKIAVHLECDNVPHLLLLSILLEDHGVDLEAYTMNMRQQGLSFHSSGLGKVKEFLGANTGF